MATSQPSGHASSEHETTARLAPGARLGAYEVVSFIGAGGMGEVYRARDMRLDRTVAIKLLPLRISTDVLRRQRFEREARILSQLSHPHICTLHDVGEGEVGAPGSGASNVPFLVMEHLEGQTLADRLQRGALPLDQALRYAGEIAAALEAAHRRGIAHRDLKPANIMLTRTGVKLLDFGIARAVADSALASVREGVPTTGGAQPTLTAEGVVVGSISYMAPEQLEGHQPDTRSDIFAFGAVLHEMLTGRPAFAGGSPSAIAVAVVSATPPPVSSLRSAMPPWLDHLVATCLAKDPDERWQSAGDIRRQLVWVGSSPAAEPARTRRPDRRWAWVAIATLLAVGIGAGWQIWHRPIDTPVSRVRFQLPLPPDADHSAGLLRLSHDGRSLALVMRSLGEPDRRRLWLYSFESGEWRLLVPDVDAAPIVWSPDDRHLAFAASGQTRRVPVTGGSPQTVTDGVGPGAWSSMGEILLGGGEGIRRVTADGGTATLVTRVDAAQAEFLHVAPHLLPDGRRFLYLRVTADPQTTGIYVGSLDAPPDSQDHRRIIPTRGAAVYMPAPDTGPGYVVYNHNRRLYTQRFDGSRVQPLGEPTAVVEPIAEAAGPARIGLFSLSPAGTLVYRDYEPQSGTLSWVNRYGVLEAPIVSAPLREPTQLRLSPDGQRLAVIDFGDVWVYDVAERPPIRLTSDGDNDMLLWSVGGERLLYSAMNPFRLMAVRAEGGQTAEPASPEGHYHPHGWSPDGRHLIAAVNNYAPTNWDLVRLPTTGTPAPEPLIATTAMEATGGVDVSPDGRWIAYTTDQTGTQEIWIAALDGSRAPVRISLRGGVDPRWAPNGRELYFLEQNTRVMATSVRPRDRVEFSPPRLLFESRYVHGSFPNQTYDVSTDGRFVMVEPVASATRAPVIQVVMNWTPRTPP